jgi:hypothetical protein
MWHERKFWNDGGEFLLPRVLLGICEILPRVDVRAVYSIYYRYFLLWTVVAGLAVKFAYVVYFTQRSWGRRIVMDVAMNAASSLLNLIALPVAWWVWGLPRIALNRIFGTDYSDPVNWVAMLLIIAMIGALSEASVIHFAFKQRLGQKGFWLLYVANGLCIGIAACGTGFYIVAHPPTA